MRFRDGFRRVIAAGSIAVVAALLIFAASPKAHAWLHDHEHAHAPHEVEESCPIVLFAGGVPLTVAAITVQAPAARTADCAAPGPQPLFLPAPRYLHQPERGPPAI